MDTSFKVTEAGFFKFFPIDSSCQKLDIFPVTIIIVFFNITNSFWMIRSFDMFYPNCYSILKIFDSSFIGFIVAFLFYIHFGQSVFMIHHDLKLFYDSFSTICRCSQAHKYSLLIFPYTSFDRF